MEIRPRARRGPQRWGAALDQAEPTSARRLQATLPRPRQPVQGGRLVAGDSQRRIQGSIHVMPSAPALVCSVTFL